MLPSETLLTKLAATIVRHMPPHEFGGFNLPMGPYNSLHVSVTDENGDKLPPDTVRVTLWRDLAQPSEEMCTFADVKDAAVRKALDDKWSAWYHHGCSMMD